MGEHHDQCFSGVHNARQAIDELLTSGLIISISETMLYVLLCILGHMRKVDGQPVQYHWVTDGGIVHASRQTTFEEIIKACGSFTG